MNPDLEYLKFDADLTKIKKKIILQFAVTTKPIYGFTLG
jgi:hypothetical protein